MSKKRTQMLYRVTTTFLGADSHTQLFFTAKEDAVNFLSTCLNGEIDALEITSTMPFDLEIDRKEGCPWINIAYALGVWCDGKYSIKMRGRVK